MDIHTSPEQQTLRYADITRNIIGCAMAVHRTLGSGFLEEIYQKALAIKLRQNKISFEREANMPVYFEGHHIGDRRVDFLVEGKIIVELKAVSQLEDVHLAQALNYLEAFNQEVGLLINFGSPSLQYRRLFNKKYNTAEPHLGTTTRSI